jgi:hypothetical protein
MREIYPPLHKPRSSGEAEWRDVAGGRGSRQDDEMSRCLTPRNAREFGMTTICGEGVRG